MRIYHAHIYPWLVSAFGDPNPIQAVRERIVPLAERTVLEIGVGPGVNFTHYDPKKVGRVYALDPNRGMIRLAEQNRRQTELNIGFLDFLVNGSPWKTPPSTPSSAPSFVHNSGS